MADYLSHSKKKYIEKWRHSVGRYLKNGRLCQETIPDIPPETGGCMTPSSSKSFTPYSPQPSMEVYGYLPVIRPSRFQDALKISDKKNGAFHGGTPAHFRLPPSPNGILVHKQQDINASWMVSNHHVSNISETKNFKEIGKKSNKLAKEIFDKYNMKSESQNMLPGKHVYNGFQQFTMPWRNKTFLTIPLSFNSGKRLKNISYMDNDQVSVTSMNVDFSSNASIASTDSGFQFENWEVGE